MNQNCTCEIVNGKKVPMIMSKLVSDLRNRVDELRPKYFQASTWFEKQEILGKIDAYNYVINWVNSYKQERLTNE